MKTASFQALKCSISGVHAVEASSARSFPRHSHDQFGIGVIRAGAQRSTSGRGMVEAGPGMVITVNPGEVHDGMPIGDAGRRWSMLYLDPDVVNNVAEGLEANDAGLEFHNPVFDDGLLAARFQYLLRAMTGADGDALAGEEAALLLFDCLAPGSRRRCGTTPETGSGRALIDSNPARPVSLKELADLCGASQFQVVRAFARETGLTPHAYQLQRRVGLARRLIAAGTPLAEAALQSGFFDQSHMNRHFTRSLGITPGSFAKALQ
jgi:AraC-like DNA-binding protein